MAAEELGMKWQTLYWNLIKVGHPVTGDKSRYGSGSDLLAAAAEKHFNELVPSATCQNINEYQAKFDFDIYGLKVDIKAANPTAITAKYPYKRWNFSIKKQRLSADFIVCIAYENSRPHRYLLLPKEMICEQTGISLGERNGKWSDYEIAPEDLQPFFENYRQ